MIKRFILFLRNFFRSILGIERKVDGNSEEGKAIGKHIAQLLEDGNYRTVELDPPEK